MSIIVGSANLMVTVQCTVYSIHNTLYIANLDYTLYTIHYTLYSVHCTMLIEWMYNVYIRQTFTARQMYFNKSSLLLNIQPKCIGMYISQCTYNTVT